MGAGRILRAIGQLYGKAGDEGAMQLILEVILCINFFIVFIKKNYNNFLYIVIICIIGGSFGGWGVTALVPFGEFCGEFAAGASRAGWRRGPGP